MNKKGINGDEILRYMGMFFFIVIIISFSIIGYNDYKVFKTYKDFCEYKSNFCYCSWGSCEFKTQYSSYSQTINGELTDSSSGYSEDTKALCELATKLNDKKILFKVGCDGE